MKKFFYIILAAALSLTACTVDNETYNPRTYSTLNSYCRYLAFKTSDLSVQAISNLMLEGKDVNAEDFKVTYLNFDQVTPTITRQAENCWAVMQDDGELRFYLTVTRTEGEEGRDSWTCSDVSAEQNEGNGYRAIMISMGDIVYDWTSSIGSYSISYNLEPSGEYYFELFRDGQLADRCSLLITDGQERFNVLR